jgi:hypothetical protein
MIGLHGRVDSAELRLQTEIEDEPDLKPCTAQIAAELSRGSGRQTLERLDLYDNAALDHHIEALPGDILALVRNANAFIGRVNEITAWSTR